MPPLVSTTSTPSSTAAAARRATGGPSGTDDRAVDVAAERAQAVDQHRAAAVGVDTGRGPVRRDDDAGPDRPTARRCQSRSRSHGPVLPPSLRSTRTRSIDAAGSTALTMSISASPAAATAVSASISTPVRSAVFVTTVISTRVDAERQIDGHAVQRDRMAERHDVRRPLGAHDPGEPSHRERIALRQRVAAQQIDDFSAVVRTPPAATASPCGHVLAGHVDHARGAGRVDVGEMFGHVAERSRRSAARDGRRCPGGDARPHNVGVPATLIATFAIIAIAAAAQAVTGFGFALLAVPLLALVMPVNTAVVVGSIASARPVGRHRHP